MAIFYPSEQMTVSLPHRVCLGFLLFSLLPDVSAQQYGSFFSVIYLNGAPVSSSQVSCSEMGQPSYCCAAGQSCAWDNAGQLACCALGTTCSGTVGGAAGQDTEQAVQQTQTVYRTSPQNDCGCETTTTPVVNALPVVPVTQTLTTSTSPTLSLITTTTTALAAGAAVVTNNNCPNGYSTVTEANVGAPTRIVGCYVIVDSGARETREIPKGELLPLLYLCMVVKFMAESI